MIVLLITMAILFNTIIQATLIPYIGVFGVVPNTAIALIVLISLKKGRVCGSMFGLLAGLLQDVLFSVTIGVNGFILFFIGYFTGFAHNTLTRENAINPFIFAGLGTIFYNFMYSLIQFFLSRDIIFVEAVRKTFSMEIVYNGLIAVILFMILQRIFIQPNLRFGRR
ncbi:rod shape-determining protein MreD [Gudongella sp. DL1XJH-153]|uniref:rod shape-determining protein MreD n=1 Tax=Gudongella sp. DL1XJH-153 TaxID=3409804 RepID=UPI003BB814EF